jgi:fatty-acyl-CoA synthase
VTGAPPITSLADVEAIEAAGWPSDVPTSTYAMLQRGAALDPLAPALSFFLTTAGHRRPQTWSYTELLREITRTANAFQSLGADRDTVIAYILPNLPETHFVIWGGQAAGIVFAINPLLEPASIADLLSAAGAHIVVTLAPFPGTDLWSKVAQAVRDVDSVRHVVLVNLADAANGPKSIVAKAMAKREEWKLHGRRGLAGALPGNVVIQQYRTLCSAQPGDHLVSGRTIAPDDYSSYFCTGGTTGTPKIAMRRHRNEVANVTSAMYGMSDSIRAGKNIFCGLPLFHVNAVLVTGLIPFANGAHVILGTPQGYRADGLVSAFWDIVQRHRIHFFSGVPTLYSTLLEYETDGHDLSSLEYGLCGAAPLPVDLMRRFEQATGVKILEGYGLTEGTCVSTGNPAHGERRPGSIGIRIPFQQMKAVHLDDHSAYVRDCHTGEIGSLVISGPNVFAGYRVEEHNKNLWIDCGDEQLWLNTGDLGYQDSEGYFWLTGRKKELIIRGGHNIDPAQIEQPLYAHPAIQLAAAVARPDAKAGELPVAYVQLREGATANEQELLDFAHQHIGERAARPKAVHIIEQMPQTAVGKIFKPALSQREIEQALTAALQAAGIENSTVRMDPDQSHPQSVIATLPPLANCDTAETVLGAFPFRFTITTG